MTPSVRPERKLHREPLVWDPAALSPSQTRPLERVLTEQ